MIFLNNQMFLYYALKNLHEEIETLQVARKGYFLQHIFKNTEIA